MSSSVSTVYTPQQTAKMLDLFEKVFLTALFVKFGYSLIMGAKSVEVIALSMVIVVSEALPVVLLYIRRVSTNTTMNPADWAIALLGTSMPLLAQSPTPDGHIVPIVLCALLAVWGLLLQLAAKVNLGRSFGIIAANRGVKANGVYQIVRHPMYAGYLMTHISLILAGPTMWNITVYSLGLAFQIGRILREEALLSQDPAYVEYTKQVRWRLLPGVF